MNINITINPWRKTTHEQKVDLIIRAYKEGHTQPATMAPVISGYLGAPVQKDLIVSVYGVSRKNGGRLVDYPYIFSKDKSKKGVDIEYAARLWAKGLAGTAIARRLGTNMRYVYNLAENNREMFPVRRAKINGPGPIVMVPMQTADPSDHIDRVTRITSLGYAVTMPRVTFIDGAPA